MYFLNINKPKGMTSFDVISELRKKLKIKQIGHSGTLDPLADGVLQIAVGKATKLLDYLPSDKIYVANIKFGYATETFDSEAEEQFIKKPDFSKEELIETLNSFVGITEQIPPKYSAIKQNGKKLCDLMRKNSNTEIVIPPRKIEIYYIKLLDFNNDTSKIEVHCKKGTYIRSLVNDIGLKLKCGAYMKGLTRIKAGNFSIENSNHLADNLIKLNPLDVLELKRYELKQDELNRVKNGNSIKARTDVNEKEEILLTKDNKLVSLAKISDNLIRPKKLFLGE